MMTRAPSINTFSPLPALLDPNAISLLGRKLHVPPPSRTRRRLVIVLFSNPRNDTYLRDLPTILIILPRLNRKLRQGCYSVFLFSQLPAFTATPF